MRACEICIWKDQCESCEACSHYYPITNNDGDWSDVDEYESDLAQRFELYQEQIDEQNN